jgi:hypothetical protein
MRTLLPILIALLVGGCEKFEAPDRPWYGYAWSKKELRLEWWFNNHETLRDCMEKMEYDIAYSVHTEWYSRPIGCGYRGSNYWQVWFMNGMGGNKQIQCIAKATSKEAIEAKMRYIPVLGTQTRGDGWYCV